MHYEMKDRIKIAIALGYYARAAGEIQTLSDAIAAYAPDEYRYDIDCQIAFRKGFQEAEEHFAAEGPEGHEFRELVGWIARLEQQVHEQRQDILEYLKRQELIASTPPFRQSYRWHDPELPHAPYAPADTISIGGGGGGGGAPLEAVKAKMGAAPANTISIGVGVGGGGGGAGQDHMIAIDHDGVGGCVITEIGGGGRAGRWCMRKVGGDLYCQMGKPVSFPDRPSCVVACAYLETSTGLKYEPSYDPDI